MRCAETIAINLTTNESPNFNKEDLKFGLHIHCPSTGMPKDGPSAGGAICIAVFSFLCNKYIKQDVAMTGEIDLMGRILAIGGLDAKLNGGEKGRNKKSINTIRKQRTISKNDKMKVKIQKTKNSRWLWLIIFTKHLITSYKN